LSDAPVTTAWVEFRETLARHIKEITRADPERLDVAWFFLRYLKRLEKRAQATRSARDLMGPMRGFTRFYVDMVDQKDELAERFDDVLQAHRHALRMEHVAGRSEAL
jgi:hypothetical protein